MWNEENDKKEDKLSSLPAACIPEDEYESALLPEAEELEREIENKRNALGRVCWFNRQSGYGFVREDDLSRKAAEEAAKEREEETGNEDDSTAAEVLQPLERDLFFHQSAIQIPGKHELRSGQRIAFEICRLSVLDIDGSSRFMALNIIPLKEKAGSAESKKE